ncbi:MAG TPA: FliM/FliN family flagellar motor switch protein [Bryobacteraceae bacterium]|jgi:flagellar motor switch protein FliN/FliY|nr:FliM/FliN family flagellar motor switch protein [Bryobacteraceae bacterium]
MDPKSPKPADREILPQSVARMPLAAHVILGRTTLPLKEVCQLAVGTLIEFGQPASQPADLVVNGKVLARGQLVAVQGNYGLKVVELCPK